MSSSPLPVPSKAALTALRGLIVGTSCTLALVAEDRRRRINNALRVLENGEKIKSARNYHAGGTAFALALEEEALLDDDRFRAALYEDRIKTPPSWLSPGPQSLQQHLAREPTQKSKRSTPLEGQEAELPSPLSKDAATTPSATATRPRRPLGTAQRPDTFIRPLAEPKAPAPRAHIWKPADRRAIKALAYPTQDEIVSMVHEACESVDRQNLATAHKLVLETLKTDTVKKAELKKLVLDERWIGATALLCRTYQAQGEIKKAAEILNAVLYAGLVREADYFAHEPLELIEALLSHEKPVVPAENLNAAASIFLGRFTTEPTEHHSRTLAVGRRLLEALFATGPLEIRTVILQNVFYRCAALPQDDPNELTAWFVTKASEAQEHRTAVKIFLRYYSKQSADSVSSLNAVGNAVVASVEVERNFKTVTVLRKLIELCRDDWKLQTSWVIRLLTTYWASHKDLQRPELLALFEELFTTNLRTVVEFPAGVYRAMIEMALEAKDTAKAQELLDRAALLVPEVSTDTRTMGLFARHLAKAGQWNRVWELFKNMRKASRGDSRACGEAFVPVVKTYAQEHTTHETEAFARTYFDQLKVPVCSYLVTLMARQYAQLRDFASVTKWLEYCTGAGCKVDATYSKAILTTCQNGKMPFRDLRSLYRGLQAMSPGFVDRNAERIMAGAALTSSKHGGMAARGRLLSLRVQRNILPAKGRAAAEDDVILAMQEAVYGGRHARAIWIYKRALFGGMPFSLRALGLALRAATEITRSGRKDPTLDLLKHAEEQGQDVNFIMNHILSQHIHNASLRLKRGEDIVKEVRSSIEHFKAQGVKLADVSLNQASSACRKAGYFGVTVHYAREAAVARGNGAQPGYNIHNYKNLLAAYVEMVDVEGISQTIEAALASNYKEDEACVMALKSAQKRVMRLKSSTATDQQRRDAREAIRDGIEQMMDARQDLRVRTREFAAFTVDFMRQAAEEAEYSAVDLDGLPQLGQGWYTKLKGAKSTRDLAKAREEVESPDGALNLDSCCEIEDAIEAVSRKPTVSEASF